MTATTKAPKGMTTSQPARKWMTNRNTKTKSVSMRTLIVFDVKNSRTNSYWLTRFAYSPVESGFAASDELRTFSNRRYEILRSALRPA